MRTLPLSLLAALFMVFLALPNVSADPLVPAGPPIPPQGPPNGVVEDNSGSGVVDYRVFYDRQGKVEHEELASRHDGRIDTFYYYKDGVLSRVEIDSKGNGRIDTWVYLTNDGKYVQRYERDTTGSGTPDVVRTFGVN
ncbi:MAG: hypothetical protein ABSG21_09415 [Spirochaetia bacterium]